MTSRHRPTCCAAGSTLPAKVVRPPGPCAARCLTWKPPQPCSLSQVLFLGLLLSCGGWEQVRGAEPETLTLSITADASVQAYPQPARSVNTGGADYLQAASNASFTLLRFDPQPLSDMEILSAKLRLHRRQDLLVRAAVSTVSSGPWNEGTGQGERQQAGAVCYSHAGYAPNERDATPWAYPGSDFSDVSFGQGGSRWAAVTPRFDLPSFWYELDVPPALLQAIAQRLQTPTLALADDFGRAETACRFSSRESRHKPELIVTVRRSATLRSRPPTGLAVRRDALGRDWLSFRAPHALGFDVMFSRGSPDVGTGEVARVPEWSLPSPGETPRELLISLHRGAVHRYAGVSVMEPLGDWSEAVWIELPPPQTQTATFKPAELPRFDLPQRLTRPFTLDDAAALSEDGRWIRTNEQTWWDPVRGPVSLQAGREEFVAFQVMLTGGPGAYAVTLGEWRSPGLPQPAPQIELFLQHYHLVPVGRDKYAPDALKPLPPGVAIHLELEDPSAAGLIGPPSPAGPPPASEGPNDELSSARPPEREAEPLTGSDDPTSPLLDAPPASEPPSSPSPRRRVVQGVWVDLYVPPQAAAGVWRNRVVVLHDGAAVLDIPLELEVVPVALPDTLSFDVSLTTRKTPGQLNGAAGDVPDHWAWLEAYHRLTHAHRVTLCIVPYLSAGQALVNYSPELNRTDGQNGKIRLDWEQWDARWSRFLDGAAFRDLPREGVPLAHLHLPLCEFWPTPLQLKTPPAASPLAGKYNLRTTFNDARFRGRSNPPPESYSVWPIEEALPPTVGPEAAEAIRQIDAHIRGRNWSRTAFHLHLANGGGLGPQVSPWSLGAPQIFDDVLALRHWLSLWRAALPDDPACRLRVRAGLPWPEQSRYLLAGLADVTVVNHALQEKNLLMHASPGGYGEIWQLLTENAPELGWSSLIRTGWTTRLAGGRGLVCAESLGEDDDWDHARPRALVYPATRDGLREPLPSLRLKGLRRVQQDQELVNAWLARQVQADVPEGYALATLALALSERSGTRLLPRLSLLPIVRLPARLDAAALEEMRRGLRAALAGP